MPLASGNVGRSIGIGTRYTLALPLPSLLAISDGLHGLAFGLCAILRGWCLANQNTVCLGPTEQQWEAGLKPSPAEPVFRPQSAERHRAVQTAAVPTNDSFQ